MGTGFGMHTNVAATIMRDEAKKLRNHIATLAMKVKDYDESSKEERRKIEQLSGEAQKLESAARIMDPLVEHGERTDTDQWPEWSPERDRASDVNAQGPDPVSTENMKVHVNEVYDWNNDATSIQVIGRGGNRMVFSFIVPRDDFFHIGTPAFNERIERLIKAGSRGSR